MIRRHPRSTRTHTTFPNTTLFRSVDMTAALRARAGGAKAFAGNHQAIFAAFPAMIVKVQKATDAQKTSWFEGTTAERARKIAADTGLTALMRGRGYTQAQPDAALGSEVAQAELERKSVV